jgi:hypothetical protein
MQMFKTPKTSTGLVVLAIGLYLAVPIVLWFNSMGLSLPVHADTIAIALGSFVIGWLLGVPFILILLWPILSSYPGSVSLFGFNVARPYWSLGWSLLFAFPIFCSIFSSIHSAILIYPIEMFQSTLLAYLFLCLRSLIIYGGLSLGGKTRIVRQA